MKIAIRLESGIVHIREVDAFTVTDNGHLYLHKKGQPPFAIYAPGVWMYVGEDQ